MDNPSPTRPGTDSEPQGGASGAAQPTSSASANPDHPFGRDSASSRNSNDTSSTHYSSVTNNYYCCHRSRRRSPADDAQVADNSSRRQSADCSPVGDRQRQRQRQRSTGGDTDRRPGAVSDLRTERGIAVLSNRLRALEIGHRELSRRVADNQHASWAALDLARRADRRSASLAGFRPRGPFRRRSPSRRRSLSRRRSQSPTRRWEPGPGNGLTPPTPPTRNRRAPPSPTGWEPIERVSPVRVFPRNRTAANLRDRSPVSPRPQYRFVPLPFGDPPRASPPRGAVGDSGQDSEGTSVPSLEEAGPQPIAQGNQLGACRAEEDASSPERENRNYANPSPSNTARWARLDRETLIDVRGNLPTHGTIAVNLQDTRRQLRAIFLLDVSQWRYSRPEANPRELWRLIVSGFQEHNNWETPEQVSAAWRTAFQTDPEESIEVLHVVDMHTILSKLESELG